MDKLDHLDQRIILVVRKTRLEELVVRFNTIEQARFYVEHLGADFGDYVAEDEKYRSALRATEYIASHYGRVHRLDRTYLPTYLFPPRCLVLVLGQDGLVANTLKYLDGQPVMGVNPDPARWDGVLLPFGTPDLFTAVPEAQKGRRPTRSVTMVKATLSDGQTLHAVNDLFIGMRTHTSARYEIEVAGERETHSSSGIIVSTGLGSTGWFRSLVNGAIRMSGSDGSTELETLRAHGFPWESDFLYFTVREPFPSRTTQSSLVFGRVDQRQPLNVVSCMPRDGIIFSDGIEQDFLEFNAGMTAVIAPADRAGVLVV